MSQLCSAGGRREQSARCLVDVYCWGGPTQHRQHQGQLTLLVAALLRQCHPQSPLVWSSLDQVTTMKGERS
eukprot:4016880-Amphidinium_carterae.1